MKWSTVSFFGSHHTEGTHITKITYPGVISRDTEIRVEDLPAAMADQMVWRSIKYKYSTVFPS